MSEVDPRVVAALHLHKPESVSTLTVCSTCLQDGFDNAWTVPYPCATAVALGYPGEVGSARSFRSALATWWEMTGLDGETADVAAFLEVAAL